MDRMALDFGTFSLTGALPAVGHLRVEKHSAKG